MNPDLYKNMIRNLQWMMEDKSFRDAYYESEMCKEDADEVDDVYCAIQSSLEHLARKAQYQIDVYSRNKGRDESVVTFR